MQNSLKGNRNRDAMDHPAEASQSVPEKRMTLFLNTGITLVVTGGRD
jgi:hypothetical protein